MTDEEALRWLKRQADCGCLQAMQLVQMLSEPRLPKELSYELVEEIWWACDGRKHREVAEKIVATIRAFQTKPATKTVWRMQPEGWPFEDFEAINLATARAGRWLAQDIEVSIRKTEVKS